MFSFLPAPSCLIKKLDKRHAEQQKHGQFKFKKRELSTASVLTPPQAIHHGLFRIYLLNIIIILVCAVRNDCFLILSFSSCKAHVFILINTMSAGMPEPYSGQHGCPFTYKHLMYPRISNNLPAVFYTGVPGQVLPTGSLTQRVAAGFGDQLAPCPRELRRGR